MSSFWSIKVLTACAFLWGCPNFSLHATLIAFHLIQKALLPCSWCIFLHSQTCSHHDAQRCSLYHPRLSALGAADKISIRSMQFGSLIGPTQSAKARRVSILLCCIYFIYYISTLFTSPSLCSTPHSFAFAHFLGGISHSLSHFLFHFHSLPSFFPSEGLLLKIRPGGFFNVSLEVGFFFSCQWCQPHTL